ncbi:MAG: RDD family protein [Acidimicrobiaceae bacterium]|nr:RDD family protein [Acidimicrobiaceae bacterium]MYJ11674.1 RDD family protein [Gemmatimonadota bacterium]
MTRLTRQAVTETRSATLGTGDTVELAGPGRRLAARLLDFVIVSAITWVPGVVAVMAFLVVACCAALPTEDQMNTARAILLGFLVLIAAIVLLYEVVLTSLRGQTIGKMATHTKVVRADNGSRAGPVRSLSRAVLPAAIPAAAVLVRSGGPIVYVGAFLWLVVLASFGSIAWDGLRRGWHDKAAGTLVVTVAPSPQQPPMPGEVLEPATPGARLVARALDMAVAACVGTIGFLYAFNNQMVGAGLVAVLLVAVVLVPTAYEIVFAALKGRTLGKMVAGIKIVRSDNGSRPGWGASVLRWAIPAAGYLLLIVPGLLVQASLLFNHRRRGWHDRAARTLVVKA